MFHVLTSNAQSILRCFGHGGPCQVCIQNAISSEYFFHIQTILGMPRISVILITDNLEFIDARI